MPHPSPTRGEGASWAQDWLSWTKIVTTDGLRHELYVARPLTQHAACASKALRVRQPSGMHCAGENSEAANSGDSSLSAPTCWTSTVRRNGWQSRLTVGYTAASKRQTGSASRLLNRS